MEFDLENPLTGLQEHQSDTIPALFASESDHMPCQNYVEETFKTRDLDVSVVRREAISLIRQASCNLDRFVQYLAVNYLDRFISRHEMPNGKPWILRLLSISCISLAAKMKQTEFSLTDIQREGGGFVFDAGTIQKMELLILGTLKWRMRSITPLSFVHYFVSMFKLKDPPLREALRTRSTEIIFRAQHEMKILGFKPSIIAASALLSASHELFPMQFPCFRTAISSSVYVNKEKLLDCYEVMQSIVIDSYEESAVSCSSDTPVNVLDLHCCSSSRSSSSQSEKATTTLSLQIRSSSSERDMKRRKMSDFRCTSKDNPFPDSTVLAS